MKLFVDNGAGLGGGTCSNECPLVMNVTQYSTRCRRGRETEEHALPGDNSRQSRQRTENHRADSCRIPCWCFGHLDNTRPDAEAGSTSTRR